MPNHPEPVEADYNSSPAPVPNSLLSSSSSSSTKEVIIPSFRVLSEDEQDSGSPSGGSTLPADLCSEPEEDSSVHHPGGIPLRLRVYNENVEKRSHECEHFRRSTQATYLDAHCYLLSNAPSAPAAHVPLHTLPTKDPPTSPKQNPLVKHAFHVPDDPRGNYNAHKEKTLSFRMYGRIEFCICHKDSLKPMIECSQCKNWFHFSCVNYDDATEGLHTETFYCPNCLELNPHLEIKLYNGFVPRSLPFIKAPRRRGRGRQHKKYYHTASVEYIEPTPPASSKKSKRGRKRKANSPAPRKIKRKRVSESEGEVWDAHNSRINENFEHGIYACDNYGEKCRTPYKKYRHDLIECNVCHSTVHVSCPQHPLEHLSVEHRNIWCCEVCKACWICQRGDVPQRSLICDCCDRSFHVGCLKSRKKLPKLQDTWYCPLCIKAGLVTSPDETDDSTFVPPPSPQPGNATKSSGRSKTTCEVCRKNFCSPFGLQRHLLTRIHRETVEMQAQQSSSRPRTNVSSPPDEEEFLPDDMIQEEAIEEMLEAPSPSEDTPSKHTRRKKRISYHE